MRALFLSLLMLKTLHGIDFESLYMKSTQRYFALLQTLNHKLSKFSVHDEEELERSILYRNRLKIITSFKADRHSLHPYLYLRGNLILPSISRYVEFTLDKESASSFLNHSLARHYDTTTEDNKLRLSMLMHIIKQNYFNLYAKLGVKLRSLHDPYLKLGMKKRINFQIYSLLYDLYLYKYIFNRKTISTVSLSFSRPITSSLWLKKSLILTYKNWQNLFNYDVIFKLHHQIDTRNSFLYLLSYRAQSLPSHHFQNERYIAGIRYRRFLNRWSFIELVPQLDKTKDRHFQNDYSLRLNLGILLAK